MAERERPQREPRPDGPEPEPREEPEHRERPEDYIVLLAQVPERIADLAGGLDEEQLRYRHGPAFPTVGEVIAHLADTGTRVDAVFRRVLIDGQPEIDLRQSLDPPPAGERGADRELLERFQRDRRRTADLLRGLSPQRWSVTVTDPAVGRMTLLDLCDLVGRHEAGHLAQLRNLIAVLADPRDPGPAGGS